MTRFLVAHNSPVYHIVAGEAEEGRVVSALCGYCTFPYRPGDPFRDWSGGRPRPTVQDSPPENRRLCRGCKKAREGAAVGGEDAR
jgi:hypothetical protein